MDKLFDDEPNFEVGVAFINVAIISMQEQADKDDAPVNNSGLELLYQGTNYIFAPFPYFA